MVSKIKLPTLQPREEAAVTSSVVDVFYVPKKQPVSSVVGDIARSLGTLVPSLRQYQDVKDEREKQDQIEEADKDFLLNNKKEFKELVKEGTIKEGANPYYVKRYVKNSLRETARTFEKELYEAYRKNNLDSNANPSAFTDFYKKFASDFRDKNNLGAYDAGSLAEGFIPYAEATRSNLTNRHVEERIAFIEKEQVKTLKGFVSGELITDIDIPEAELDKALAGFNIETLNYQEKDILYKAQLIQKYADVLIEDGMDERAANDAIVAEVINVAKLQKDEELLLILDNIVTNKAADSRLAGSYKTDIADALLNIAELKDIDLKNQIYFETVAKQKKKEDVLNYFITQPRYLKDIEQGIFEFNLFIDQQNAANAEAIQNGTMIAAKHLSAEEISDLYQLSNAYINSITKQFIEPSAQGDAFIKELNFLLASDPKNPKILSMIEKGWGEYFLQSEGIAYLNMYNSRSKLDAGVYTSDGRYSNAFDLLNNPIDTLAKEGLLGTDTQELKDIGNQQMLDLFYDTLADLEDPAWLAANPKIVTLSDKKKYMFKTLRDEANRIVDLIIKTEDKKYFQLKSEEEISNIKGQITGNPYDE